MNIAVHLERAAAFERAIARFDPAQDAELLVVFHMRAGTHRINAALHRLGLTSEVSAGEDRKVGDLNHTYKPKLDVTLPPAMQQAFKHLALLEDLRPDVVRGSRVLDSAMAQTCRTAYAEIRICTDAIVDPAGGS